MRTTDPRAAKSATAKKTPARGAAATKSQGEKTDTPVSELETEIGAAAAAAAAAEIDDSVRSASWVRDPKSTDDLIKKSPGRRRSDGATAETAAAIVEVEDGSATGQGAFDPATEPTAEAATPTKRRAVPATVPAVTAVGKTVPKRRWPRRLAKFVLFCALLGGIGAGFYAGWPSFRDRYVTPVETTTANFATVRDQIDATDAEVAELTETVGQIEQSLGTLSDSDTDFARTLELLESRVAQTETVVAETEAAVAEQTDQITGLQSDLAAANATTSTQISQVLAAEYLSRARLFLYQANYGLAEQDVSAALAVLGPTAADSDRGIVRERLELVLSELPERPVLAADNLDIAWYTLLGGLPAPTLEPAVTDAPDSVVE